MTKTEFDQWFDHHCSRFTGIGLWLEKFPAIGSGATQKSVLEAWYLAVSSLSLANAKWATDQMFASPAKPRSFDDHPARIVELNRNAEGAKGASPDASHGGPVCDLCDGTGMVEVATDGRFRMRDGSVNPKPYTFVACRCSVGKRLNAHRKGTELVEHNPDWMRLGTTVRQEASRRNFERRGLGGLSFSEQIRRCLGKFGEMPREESFETRRREATAALTARSAERGYVTDADIADVFSALAQEQVDGVPF